MVEKPMACSVAECEQIVAQAAKAGTRVAVDHVRRHAPIYRWLARAHRLGDWGQLRYLDAAAGHRAGLQRRPLVRHRAISHGPRSRRVTAWVDDPIAKNPRGADFVDPGGLVVLDMGKICGPSWLRSKMRRANRRRDRHDRGADRLDEQGGRWKSSSATCGSNPGPDGRRLSERSSGWPVGQDGHVADDRRLLGRAPARRWPGRQRRARRVWPPWKFWLRPICRTGGATCDRCPAGFSLGPQRMVARHMKRLALIGYAALPRHLEVFRGWSARLSPVAIARASRPPESDQRRRYSGPHLLQRRRHARQGTARRRDLLRIGRSDGQCGR